MVLNSAQQTVVAKLTTAVEISATLEKKVQKTVQSLYGYKKVDIVRDVDPDILGGAIIQIDDHVIDGSFKTKLNSMEKLVG